MSKFLILGSTAYTEVFIDSFEALPDAEFSACVENLDQARVGLTLLERPVIWHDDLPRYRNDHLLICSLATTKRSVWLESLRQQDYRFGTLVHATSTVSRRTNMSEGVSIDAGCVVAGFTDIEFAVRIGRRASIGHHSEIGAYSTVHPGAIISGNCKIGQQVTIGTGAVVVDGIAIGDGAYIAAGSVVIQDVPEKALITGNPGAVKRSDYGPR